MVVNNSAQKFRILFVCTGNVCRSPIAEFLLKQKLSASPFFEVSSAGTMALVGRPVAEEMAEVCQVNHLNVGGFKGRKLTRSIIDNSDLVLTMTSEQRRRIIEDWPDVADKTTHISNTLQLDNFGQFTPNNLKQWCLSNRPSQLKDVPDPYKQPESVAREAFTEIEHYLDLLTNWVNPKPAGRRKKAIA